jgi:hypothetical protein
MAWRMGGSTGNRFNVSNSVSIGATSRTALISGWWRPTTLTAGLGYWSVDTALFARIHTTTSEIELSTNNVTDGKWTTSGANIVADQWRFMAFMLSTLNGTPSAAWRVWVGSELNAPTEVTVNLGTAPAGNFTGGAGVIFGQIGSGGAVSFVGDLSDCAVIAQTVNTSGPLRTAAFGAITQPEANLVKERVVWPLWLGNPFPPEVCAMPIGGNGIYDASYALMGPGYAGSGTGVPTPHMTNILNNSPSQLSTGAGAISKGLEGGPREFYANAASQRAWIRR